PVQRLDLVAVTVHEHIQGRSKRVQPEGLFHQCTQTRNRLAEIDGLAAEVYRIDTAARMHQKGSRSARLKHSSQSAGGNCCSSTRRPEARMTAQRVAFIVACSTEVTCTAIKRAGSITPFSFAFACLNCLRHEYKALTHTSC